MAINWDFLANRKANADYGSPFRGFAGGLSAGLEGWKQKLTGDEIAKATQAGEFEDRYRDWDFIGEDDWKKQPDVADLGDYESARNSAFAEKFGGDYDTDYLSAKEKYSKYLDVPNSERFMRLSGALAKLDPQRSAFFAGEAEKWKKIEMAENVETVEAQEDYRKLRDGAISDYESANKRLEELKERFSGDTSNAKLAQEIAQQQQLVDIRKAQANQYSSMYDGTLVYPIVGEAGGDTVVSQVAQGISDSVTKTDGTLSDGSPKYDFSDFGAIDIDEAKRVWRAEGIDENSIDLLAKQAEKANQKILEADERSEKAVRDITSSTGYTPTKMREFEVLKKQLDRVNVTDDTDAIVADIYRIMSLAGIGVGGRPTDDVDSLLGHVVKGVGEVLGGEAISKVVGVRGGQYTSSRQITPEAYNEIIRISKDAIDARKLGVTRDIQEQVKILQADNFTKQLTAAKFGISQDYTKKPSAPIKKEAPKQETAKKKSKKVEAENIGEWRP